MIDLEELCGMIRQRRIPENSRVLYGSALWMFRNIWARVALPVLIPGLIGLNAAISVMGDVYPWSLDFLMAHRAKRFKPCWKPIILRPLRTRCPIRPYCMYQLMENKGSNLLESTTGAGDPWENTWQKKKARERLKLCSLFFEQ